MLYNLQSRYLSQYQDPLASPERDKLSMAMGGVSAIAKAIIKDRVLLKEQLKDWLVSGVGGGISSIAMRRALLIALENDTGMLSFHLTGCLRKFTHVTQQSSSKFWRKGSVCLETSLLYYIHQSGLKKVFNPSLLSARARLTLLVFSKRSGYPASGRIRPSNKCHQIIARYPVRLLPLSNI